MIKDYKKTRTGPIEIDLSGPDGNAYMLMGTAKSLAKQLFYTKEQTDTMLSQMMAGDYENLLQVFDKNFGEYVTLYR